MYNIIYTGKKYSLDLQSKAVSVPWLNWNVNTVYAGKYLSSTQLHWPLSSTYVTLSCHSINSLVQNRVSGSGIFRHVSSLPSSCCLHWIIKTMIYKEPYWTYWQLFAANRDGSSQIYPCIYIYIYIFWPGQPPNWQEAIFILHDRNSTWPSQKYMAGWWDKHSGKYEP